jgi:hypothetical protein
MSTPGETKIQPSNNTWYVGGVDETLDVVLTTAPSENDLVIAWGMQNNSATVTNLAALGFDNVLFNIAASGSSRYIAWKLAGPAESDTFGFTTDTTATGNDGFAAVSVVTGVNLSSPLDVEFDIATHYEATTPATTAHGVPSIATLSTNALIYVFDFTGVSSGGPPSLTVPTGFTEQADGGVDNGPYGGLASKAEAVPGTKTITDYIISANGLGFVYVLSIRDVSSTYIEIPDVTWTPATGYSYVEYRGDVIPETSILHRHRGTHTGSDNSATLTDSAVTLTADEWLGHEVFNFFDGSVGVIGTHTSGSGPLTLSTGLTGGTGNDFDTGDSYDIRVKIADGDQIGYETAATSTTGQAPFGYYLIDSTDGGVLESLTAKISATGTLAGTGTISLTAAGSPSYTLGAEAAASGGSMILGDNVLGDGVLGDIGAGAPPDTDAPNLSSPAISSITAVGATFTIVTDDVTGTAYGVADELITKPDVAEIQAGQNGAGAAADWSASDSSIGSSPISFPITGLTPGTDYYAFAQQDDPSANSSTVTNGVAFSTPAITAASGGTAANVDQSVIVSTGGKITITLTEDTFIAAGTGPIGTTAQSDAFVAAFTSAQGEAGGWNATVRDVLDNTDLVRTSNTIATLTVPATAGYSITATEIITPVVQAAILTLSTSNITANSFSVTAASVGGGLVSDVVSDVVSDLVIDLTSTLH